MNTSFICKNFSKFQRNISLFFPSILTTLKCKPIYKFSFNTDKTRVFELDYFVNKNHSLVLKNINFPIRPTSNYPLQNLATSNACITS